MDNFSEDFLGVNERVNALDYLIQLSRFLERLDEKTYWKWSIFALHGALYSYSILFLRHTDGRFFITEPKNKKAKQKSLSETLLSEVKLISMMRALDSCQDNDIAGFLNNKTLVLTEKEKTAIKKLNHLRNKLQHFIPHAWDIELEYISDKLYQGLNVLEKIVQSISNHTKIDSESRQEIEKLISNCAELLENNKFFKNEKIS